MSEAHCPSCGCSAQSPQHAIAAALSDGDWDAAIEAGLLDWTPCAACTTACSAAVAHARDERLRALAARDRYRARQERLARRARERLAARALPASADKADAKPALAGAAAAALARAKARAAERHKP